MFDKIRPLIFKLDPELAHTLAIKALKTNLFLKQKISEVSYLKSELFGREIKNPIGVAAGFDKNAEVYNSLFNLGLIPEIFFFINLFSVRVISLKFLSTLEDFTSCWPIRPMQPDIANFTLLINLF